MKSFPRSIYSLGHELVNLGGKIGFKLIKLGLVFMPIIVLNYDIPLIFFGLLGIFSLICI